jgi:hypothetical protein
LEYKQLFLYQPFHLRGERVIAQELDMPTLLVKVLYALNEISNQTIAATLAKYGKIVKVERKCIVIGLMSKLVFDWQQ